MGLEKLTILIESPGSTDSNLQFGGRSIVALFNPSKLTVSRSVSWPSQGAKRDTPESHFIGGEPFGLQSVLDFTHHGLAASAVWGAWRWNSLA